MHLKPQERPEKNPPNTPRENEPDYRRPKDGHDMPGQQSPKKYV